jgi:hypothetical protein
VKLAPTIPKVLLCGDNLLDACQRFGSIIVARDPSVVGNSARATDRNYPRE